MNRTVGRERDPEICLRHRCQSRRDWHRRETVGAYTRGTLVGKQVFCNIFSDLLVDYERAALCAVAKL